MVGVVGVCSFVLLARPEPSVLRAAVMGSVALVGMGSPSRSRGPAVLGFAVTALLLVAPDLARQPGFALSVLATAGIVLAAPPLRDALAAWLPLPVAEAVAVPTVAQLACLPVVAAISGQLSLVAVLANLMAGPAVGPATVLGLAAGLLDLLWAPLGALMAHAAGVCVGWVIAVAEHTARLPTAAVGWGQGRARSCCSRRSARRQCGWRRPSADGRAGP
ncbi:MAG: ComEC/Rec2 family competence protein [Nocardioides sp.]